MRGIDEIEDTDEYNTKVFFITLLERIPPITAENNNGNSFILFD